MVKAIIYKEWLKSRWYLLGIVLMTVVAAAFSFVNLGKIFQFNGAAPVWSTLVYKDTTFMENLKFLPLLSGIALAVAQWVPEMNRKCLKLTLHLPYPRGRMILMMYLYGVISLAILFCIVALAAALFLGHYFPHELTGRIIMTMIPWYLAGFAGYLWTSGLVTEPTWSARVLILLLLAGFVRLAFISTVPESYNGFLPLMTVFVLCGQLILFHSIARFREGLQD